MRKQKDEPIDMPQSALDPLILRTLLFGPIHGHAIAKSIERTSQNALRSENNGSAWRRSLTATGRRRLTVETGKCRRC